LKFELLCSCLADSPPVGRGWSAWSRLAGCSLCSSLVLEHFHFDPVFQPSSVAGCLEDGPPGVRGQSAWGVLVAVGPWCLHERSIIEGAILEIRVLFSNGPPQPRG
jgi:hypothetical protein